MNGPEAGDQPQVEQGLEVGQKIRISDITSHPDRTKVAVRIPGKEGEYCIFADGSTVDRLHYPDSGELAGLNAVIPSQAEKVDPETIVEIVHIYEEGV